MRYVVLATACLTACHGAETNSGGATTDPSRGGAASVDSTTGAPTSSDAASGGANGTTTSPTNSGGRSTPLTSNGGLASTASSKPNEGGSAAQTAPTNGGNVAATAAPTGGRSSVSTVSPAGGKSAAGGASTTKPAEGGQTTTTSARATGGQPSSNSGANTGGAAASGGANSASAPLGAYPVDSSPKTRGGTMTFTNIGAAGWWPRRIDRPAGDPACTLKDGTDTWGGHCCMQEQHTDSTTLSPFDSELTLILKAINVRQLAIYQSAAADATSWSRVTAWDARSKQSENLWFTQQGNGSTTFLGDLTQTDCVSYVAQQPQTNCSNGAYYCPNDPGVLHLGYAGSKLVVLLASMTFSDPVVKPCSGSGTASPAPWIAIVASELVRDGGRKWNGLCNCYSKTGSVGDGCGEINVFEVVMDNNDYSNREFASTGVRSYQAGHIGGAVAGASLKSSSFAADSDVVDACAKSAYTKGPMLVAGGSTDGCPVWRRPTGDRYFFILLDEVSRTIQVGMIHPENLPTATNGLLPDLPASISRSTVDALVGLRLPG